MAAKPNELEIAIQEAAQKFAREIITVLRTATINDIASLQDSAAPAPAKRRGRPPKVVVAAAAPAPAAPPKRRGRPPKKVVEVVEAVEAAVEVEAAPAPKKKERKKREWPSCAVKGCAKNVYMPSGTLKMCYKHFVEAGGKESPLVRMHRKKAAAGKPGKKPAKKA